MRRVPLFFLLIVFLFLPVANSWNISVLLNTTVFPKQCSHRH
jgi:hypothetical protein